MNDKTLLTVILILAVGIFGMVLMGIAERNGDVPVAGMDERVAAK